MYHERADFEDAYLDIHLMVFYQFVEDQYEKNN